MKIYSKQSKHLRNYYVYMILFLLVLCTPAFLVAQAPAAPTLLEPGNNTTIPKVTPTLTYILVSPMEIVYRVQVSTISDFSSNIIYDQQTYSTSVNVTGLLNSTTYYWRVRGTDWYGTSEWSSIFQFTKFINYGVFPQFESFTDISDWSRSGENFYGITIWRNSSGVVNPSSGGGDKSLYAYFYGTPGGVEYIKSPIYDFSGLTKPVLSFYVAYHTSFGANDALSIAVSTDGGVNFSAPLLTKSYSSSPSLKTLEDDFTLTEYKPSDANQWRHESIDLSAYAGNNNVVIAFVGTSGRGNNCWIDNLSIIDANSFSSQTVGTTGTYTSGDLTLNMSQIGNADGKLKITRINATPSSFTTQFSTNLTITTQDGSIFTPEKVSSDGYFVTTYDYNTSAVYAINIDISNYPGTADAAKLYIVKRTDEYSPWVCLPTTVSGNILSSANITGFSQFGIAGNFSTLTSPYITAVSLAVDNSYLDVTFDAGVYNTNGGSGALESSDFALSISGGSATNPTVTSVTKNDNNALAGGETNLRVNFSVTGSPDGGETLTVLPASATSIYESGGNAASTTQQNNSVTLVGTISSAPTLSTPADNATNQSVTPTLSWSSVTNSTGYQVQVATDNSFSNVVSNQTPSTNSISVSGLSNSTTYYWRVRGTNVGGSGDYSSIFQFTTSAFINNALSFDGSNDYVSIPNSTAYDVTNLTIEVWVRANTYAQNGTIFEKGPVNTQYYLGFLASGYVNFMTVDNSGSVHHSFHSNATLGLTDGNWHHIAATFDGTTKYIYVNGVLKSSQTDAHALKTGQSGETIGNYGGSGGGGYNFNGEIDELRVWNIARTESEIASNKNNVNLSPTSTGLIAYYHFNQGTAGGTNAGVTSLTDATSNAINGTLTNFALNGSSSNWVTANTGTIVTTGVGTTFTVFSNANFALRAESGTVDANFELVSSTPQNAQGGSRTLSHYWDITNLTGATKIRLYYTASERSTFTGTPIIYHYTGGAWVAMPTEAEVTGVPYNYVETTNYYSSFSPVTVGDSNAPLPVELTSFSASVSANSIALNWQTATEVNNYGFEVERSIVAVERDSSYISIGFVQGNGNSNSPKSYEFIDTEAPAGKLRYRLKQIDTDGNYEYFGTIAEVLFGITDILDEALPTKYELAQNYPNPFNPSTVIKYSLPKASDVQLKIYNMLGQEVAVLVNKQQNAGRYNIEFNASNLTSGIYFYSIKTGDFVSIKKMMLIK